MPLLDHLIELRRRLIWSAGTFLICFGIAYYFAGSIYYFLAEPLAEVLRQQGNPDPHLIYTQLYEAFFTKIKVAFFGGAGGTPWACFCAWVDWDDLCPVA